MCQYHPVCFMKDRSSLWEERLYCLLVYLSIPALKLCESLPTGPLSSWRFAGSLDSSLILFKNPLHPHPPLVFFSETMKPPTKLTKLRWLPSPLITPPRDPTSTSLAMPTPGSPDSPALPMRQPNADRPSNPVIRQRWRPVPSSKSRSSSPGMWRIWYMRICIWYHMPEKKNVFNLKLWLPRFEGHGADINSWKCRASQHGIATDVSVILQRFSIHFVEPTSWLPPPGMKRT